MNAPNIFDCCDICGALLTAEELAADVPAPYEALCEGCNTEAREAAALDAGRSHYRRGTGRDYLLDPRDPDHPENQS